MLRSSPHGVTRLTAGDRMTMTAAVNAAAYSSSRPEASTATIRIRAQLIEIAVHAARPVSASAAARGQRPTTIGHGAASARPPSTAQATAAARPRSSSALAPRSKARIAVPASNTNAPAHNATVALRLAVRLAVALVCVAGVAVSIISRDSRIDAEKAVVYYIFHRDDVQGSIDRLQAARRLNPSFELDVFEARLLPPRQGAALLLHRTLREEPENAQVWLALSELQARGGDRPGARRSYARARALAPRFLPPGGGPGG